MLRSSTFSRKYFTSSLYFNGRICQNFTPYNLSIFYGKYVFYSSKFSFYLKPLFYLITIILVAFENFEILSIIILWHADNWKIFAILITQICKTEIVLNAAFCSLLFSRLYNFHFTVEQSSWMCFSENQFYVVSSCWRQMWSGKLESIIVVMRSQTI